MNPRHKLIERALKIRRLARNNPSPEEAKTASAKLVEFLTKNDLTESDLDRHENPPPPMPFAGVELVTPGVFPGFPGGFGFGFVSVTVTSGSSSSATTGF